MQKADNSLPLKHLSRFIIIGNDDLPPAFTSCITLNQIIQLSQLAISMKEHDEPVLSSHVAKFKAISKITSSRAKNFGDGNEHLDIQHSPAHSSIHNKLAKVCGMR